MRPIKPLLYLFRKGMCSMCIPSLASNLRNVRHIFTVPCTDKISSNLSILITFLAMTEYICVHQNELVRAYKKVSCPTQSDCVQEHQLWLSQDSKKRQKFTYVLIFPVYIIKSQRTACSPKPHFISTFSKTATAECIISPRSSAWSRTFLNTVEPMAAMHSMM